MSNPPYTVHLPYDDIFVHGPTVPKKVQKIKTKKKKEPEMTAPATQTIEQALEKMNARFDEIEKEHFGPRRGKVAFVRLCYWILFDTISDISINMCIRYHDSEMARGKEMRKVA